MASPPRRFQPVAATANDLRSGRVVFRGADGRWVPDATGAEVVSSPEDAERLLKLAKADHDANLVVEPVLIEMNDGQPVALRERIRNIGPTAETEIPIVSL